MSVKQFRNIASKIIIRLCTIFESHNCPAYVYMCACECVWVCVCGAIHSAELEISGRRLRKRLTDVLGTVFSKAVGGLQRRYITKNVCLDIASYITLLARSYICESVCMYIYMLCTHLNIYACVISADKRSSSKLYLFFKRAPKLDSPRFGSTRLSVTLVRVPSSVYSHVGRISWNWINS